MQCLVIEGLGGGWQACLADPRCTRCAAELPKKSCAHALVGAAALAAQAPQRGVRGHGQSHGPSGLGDAQPRRGLPGRALRAVQLSADARLKACGPSQSNRLTFKESHPKLRRLSATEGPIGRTEGRENSVTATHIKVHTLAWNPARKNHLGRCPKAHNSPNVRLHPLRIAIMSKTACSAGSVHVRSDESPTPSPAGGRSGWGQRRLIRP